MNIWKITYQTTDGRKLIAIVIAINPISAKALVTQTPEYALAVEPALCSQVGYAATNIRTPEVVLIKIS